MAEFQSKESSLEKREDQVRSDQGRLKKLEEELTYKQSTLEKRAAEFQEDYEKRSRDLKIREAETGEKHTTASAHAAATETRLKHILDREEAVAEEKKRAQSILDKVGPRPRVCACRRFGGGEGGVGFMCFSGGTTRGSAQ